MSELEQRIINYKGQYKTNSPNLSVAEFDLLTVNINAERELIKMLHSLVSTKDQLRTVISILRGE